MSEDEGPPPLEDMTAYVNKLSATSVKYEEIKISKTDVEEDINKETYTSPNVTGSHTVAIKQPNQSKNSGYGGMRKGFLSGGITPKKASSKPIKELKSNPKAKEDSLKLKEVQDKMHEANEFLSNNSNEWMNDSLLKTIQSNPKVGAKMANPQFMAAFSEFQSNPEAAAKKYADNPEMKEFIQEFSGILGNHFMGLADKQTAANQ